MVVAVRSSNVPGTDSGTRSLHGALAPVDSTESADPIEIVRSIARPLRQLGVRVVSADLACPRDVPIAWFGTIVGYAQLPTIDDLFECAVDRVAARVGTSLRELEPADRRVAVQLLDQEGVFLVRGAVQRIARRLGVCNTTTYVALRSPRGPTGGRR